MSPNGIRRFVPALAPLVLLAACAPAVQSGRYEPAPGAPAEIRIYENTTPACEFEEIGTVQGSRRFFWHSLDDVFDAMRRRARRMGGDAIVRVEPRETFAASGQHRGPSVQRQIYYRGTVVRFTAPCDEAEPSSPAPGA